MKFIDINREGSPPRMRGKESFVALCLAVVGITPACAGKRKLCSPLSGCCGDHPRVCGEKEMASKNGMTTQGSPPRMRGKAGWRLRQCDAVGITPAYAGKRGTHGTGRTTGRDHPRVCGEKRGFHLNTLASTGSPPRVRGKGYDVVGRLGGVRITPACAGKRVMSAIGILLS